MIRVVDSNNEEHFTSVVSPVTPVSELDEYNKENNTSLWKMMKYLSELSGTQIDSISKLTPMISERPAGKLLPPSWVGVYREIVEWAVLFDLLSKDWGSDTLFVFDGLLRSKVFSKNYFGLLREGFRKKIEEIYDKKGRRISIVGVAKKSKVISKYRFALWCENVLTNPYPCYLEVPTEIEQEAYVWSEYARRADEIDEGSESAKFAMGKMFLVKFGDSPLDFIWPVDIFDHQLKDAPTILGNLLADAQAGFPVILYPMCLQKAHENAALVDFDFDVFQDDMIDEIRKTTNSSSLNVWDLVDKSPGDKRYE